jgi:hypothetical protein
MVEEFVESLWELVLGLLQFSMTSPNTIAPSLKVVMNSICHVQYCFTTWNYASITIHSIQLS